MRHLLNWDGLYQELLACCLEMETECKKERINTKKLESLYLRTGKLLWLAEEFLNQEQWQLLQQDTKLLLCLSQSRKTLWKRYYALHLRLILQRE